MLTINAEIAKNERKTNECFTIRLRFTLNRKMKRLSTSLFATSKDLTNKHKLKPTSPLKPKVDALIRSYYEKCSKLQIEVNNYTLEDVMNYLDGEQKKAQKIDFIQASREWIKNSTIKGASNYTTAVNCLVRFVGKEELDINLITRDFLEKFKTFLEKEREIRVKKLIQQGKRIPSNRTQSLYLISLKRLFNETKRRYNDKDRNLILIPQSPFDDFKIPKQEATRKRAIPSEIIKSILELPYKNEKKGQKATCRHDIAKDCFILSFCLIGMNSADLFNATEINGNTITYYRTKTTARRLDGAKMMVDIPDILLPLVEKYRDKTGKRIFNFYKFYCDHKTFNKAINCGLKEIGAELGIDDLEYYAARHSWATIALNKVGIDKYTVHAALNHVDESMRVTDIYIERDFVNENKANDKVIEYVFGQ